MIFRGLPAGLWLAVLVALLRPNAWAAGDVFHLRVDSVEPTRFYLDDAHGKAWTPADAIVYVQRKERHFIVPRGFTIELPPGDYTLAAERGTEYRAFRTAFQARSGGRKTIKVALSRWIDMNRRGWYSADLHNHRRPEQMPLLLLAEDLNLAPTLSDWVWEDRQRAIPPHEGDSIRRVDATHVYSLLDKEVERLKGGPGAVDLLGLRSRIPFDGYLLWPPNDVFARQAHAQGGWVDAEKIVWRDVAALAALGHVDFAGIVYNHFNRQDVETQTGNWGMIPKERPEFHTPAGMPLWAMEVYYRFLNCGIRLPVSAGSASGVKASPLGHNRVYAKVDGAFSYSGWFQALKAGRSFATNGPMLFLNVEGREPGASLKLPKGSRRHVKVHAEASSLRPLDRLEVIFKGRTIHTARGAGRLTADFSFETSETGWFAARAFERPAASIRFAQTSPVYLDFPGDPGLVARDARFFIEWIDREIAFYRASDGFRSPEHREAMLALFTSARRVYEKIAGT